MPDIYLLIEGKQEGPYTEEQIRQSIVDGSIQGDALAWREGLPEWIPLTGCLSKESLPAEEAAPEVNVLQSPLPVEKWAWLEDGQKSAPVKRTSSNKLFLLFMSCAVGLLILSAVYFFCNQVGNHPSVAKSTVSSDGSNESSRITPDKTKKWLTEQIESYGGDTFTDHASELQATITYQDASFVGDSLSLVVLTQGSNGRSQTTKENINIAEIQPHSFSYVTTDRSWDQGATYDPVVVYKIQWSGIGSDIPITTTENDEDFYPLKIKNEEIAKRVVEALNYLSTQTNVHLKSKNDTSATTNPTMPLRTTTSPVLRTSSSSDDAEDWIVNGKAYHNVTVLKRDATQVEIIHDGGIENLTIADLTPVLQKKVTNLIQLPSTLAPSSPQNQPESSPSAAKYSSTSFDNASDERLFQYLKAQRAANPSLKYLSDDFLRQEVSKAKAQVELEKQSMSPEEFRRVEAEGEAQINAVLGPPQNTDNSNH